MNHDQYTDQYIAGILRAARNFAIVGASAKESRPSHVVFKYLLDKGYEVIPVNPGLAGQTLLDQKVVGRVCEIPEPIDVVDIFVNSDAVLSLTQDAIAAGAKVVWMQLGVRDDAVAKLAEEAGLKVVMNRCPKIEFERLAVIPDWAAGV